MIYVRYVLLPKLENSLWIWPLLYRFYKRFYNPKLTANEWIHLRED